MRPISPKAAYPSRTGGATGRRGDGQRDREVRPGLFDADAPGDVDEHVRAAEPEPRVTAEDGHDHREPPRVHARRDASRHRELRLGDERLHLEQQRPAPLEHAADRGPDLARMRRPEELGRIGHAYEPGAGHLEHSELVRGAEAVLRRAKDAMRVVAVTLELEDAVDEVLEHARPGNRAVLRHVADEDRGHARLLRDPHEAAGSLANLRHRPRRRGDVRGVERLDGIDDAHVGPLALERLADDVELGLREDPDRLGAADASGAKGDLCRRLLARDEHGALPRPRHRAENAQQERRLPDPRLAGNENERGGHEPASEHAVELGNSRRQPVGFRRAHLAERHGGRHAAGRMRNRGLHALLDERAERSAAGALSEPARAGRAALGADVLGRPSGHRASLGTGSDAIRHESARFRVETDRQALQSAR